MQVKYTVTEEDFKELNTPRDAKRKPVRHVHPVLLWLPLSCVCIVAAYREPNDYARQTMHGDNLWVTLIPSLMVGTVLLLWNFRLAVRATLVGVNKPAPKWMPYLELVSYIWLIPMFVPQLTITWHPTEQQRLWAAFAPWTIYFMLVGLHQRHTRRKTIEQSWAKQTHLHRPISSEANADGISCDDGETHTRYVWSYFQRYEETENLLVLVARNGIRFMMPKRAIVAPGDMSELRMLICNHIEHGEFLPQKAAFPVLMSADGVSPT